MRRIAWIALLAAGCSSASADWSRLSTTGKQNALNAISEKCGLARTAFELGEGDEFNFRPDGNASYESVDCALGELKKVQGFGKLGFVGNEAYTNETQ